MRLESKLFRRLFVLALILVATPTRLDAARSPLDLDAIFTMKNVVEVAISPNRSQIAYVVTAPNGEGNIYNQDSELWLLPVKGGKSRRLATHEESEDASRVRTVKNLAWSPDGRTLAYISNHGEAGSRIWLYNTKSDTRYELNAKPKDVKPGDRLSIYHFSWSPSGERLAYIGGLNALDDYREFGATPPTTVIMGESNETDLRRAWFNRDFFVAIVEIGNEHAERITNNPVFPDAYRPSVKWSQDSKRLVFAGRDREVEIGNDYLTLLDVFTVDLATSQVEKAGGSPGPVASPIWSTSEDAVIFLGSDSPDPYIRSTALRRLDLRTGQIEQLTDVLPRHDTRFELLPGRNEICLAKVVSAERRLFTLSLKSGRWQPASPTGMYVVDYSVAADGDTVAAILSNADTPREIYIGSLRTKSYRRLTDLYTLERERFAFARAEKVQWKSKDNRFTIDGFLVKPSDFDPKRKYPLLVNIHGGPSVDFPNEFYKLRFNPAFHSQIEFYAANGYLVLNPNHRGGFSYENEFAQALNEHYSASYDLDIAPGVNYLLRKGFVDKNKIGLIGASYGGYAVAWAITQTPRYRAVSINDGKFNLHSHYGQGYPGYKRFYHKYMGGSPLEFFNRFAEESPIFHIKNVRTPTLIRCGTRTGTVMSSMYCAQSLELYAGLREQDVPVEFIIHPYEGHGIVATETSRNYLVHNLEWFDFWLNRHEHEIDNPAKARQYERWREMQETWRVNRAK